MTSVFTNVVAALAITTTRLVSTPCPDGIEGCCVLHTKMASETRYEPVKVNLNDCSRVIALSTNALCGVFANGRCELPTLIPILPFKGEGEGVHYDGHPIGFLIGDAVRRECGFDAPAKKNEDY